MDDIETRLTQCFQLVFPELAAGGVSKAAPATVSSWDSIATITVVNLIEEEFEVQIGLEDIEQEVSFNTLLNYLQRKAVNGRH